MVLTHIPVNDCMIIISYAQFSFVIDLFGPCHVLVTQFQGPVRISTTKTENKPVVSVIEQAVRNCFLINYHLQTVLVGGLAVKRNINAENGNKINEKERSQNS